MKTSARPPTPSNMFVDGAENEVIHEEKKVKGKKLASGGEQM